MQQSVDAAVAVETKDLMDVVVDSETTLVSGLSYFFYSVAETALVLAAADAVAMIAVSGLSFSSSSVAD